jgi:mono/diheme cytochrome c family protein
MRNKIRSPYNQAANNNKIKRLGLGCALVLSLLLIGLVIAVVIWGPRWQNILLNRTAAVPLGITDQTSPEKLAAHRQQAIAQLNGYGWVDKEAGAAHIPIDRAIALLAENGLPVGAAGDQETEPPADDTVDTPAIDLANVNYVDHVLPIFEERCAECHGSEDPEEQLELTRYRTALIGSINGPVIIPGDPENSYLVEQIVSGQMPKRGDPLPSTEIETIIAWIEAGAPEHGTATSESTPAASEATATPIDPANVSFQNHVLPIFEEHCAECHGSEDPEEQLELTRHRTALIGSINGPVIVPGDPENSYLVEQIVSGQMPKRGDPLSPTEIETIIAWIEAGALDN